MTPSWYDVLDVDPSADALQIREAWRNSIADLDPGDRRFRVRNEAAEVLLDPVRRREYDAQLLVEAQPAAQDEDEAPDHAPHLAETDESLTALTPVVLTKKGESSDLPESGEQGIAADGSSIRGRGPSTLVLALACVVVLALVALTVVIVVVQTRASSVEEAADQGLAAAEQAIVPVLSYDYRDMDQSKAAAENFLTPQFAKEYDKLFAQLKINAPETQTVVTTEVVASGIVSAEADEVLGFVFINRPTQKRDTEPRIYRDQVTVKMKRVDGEWLIDELITANPPS